MMRTSLLPMGLSPPLRLRVRELERVCTKIVVPIVGLETLNEILFAARDSGTTLRKFDLQKVHCPLAVLI
jgi:hypothetical protein